MHSCLGPDSALPAPPENVALLTTPREPGEADVCTGNRPDFVHNPHRMGTEALSLKGL